MARISRAPPIPMLSGREFPVQKWEKFNLFSVKQILPWAFLRGELGSGSLWYKEVNQWGRGDPRPFL